ncbi:gamma-glutamylcyclotransferase family protein [Quadrisphaera sp. GCM10027208]|uniref:gamma-glutamylcyclotransferase family protein n=1 Tax=Quadrisphaera sp. GCM10027208 TaxID=3273423 RepID=UPI00360FE97E
MALYAAYGSNMHPERMAHRAPHSPLHGTGWLTGWRLTFGAENLGWDGALATVVEDPSARVYVALWEMSDADVAVLDSWEGVDIGLYRKVQVRVSTLDGEEVAWLYVLDDYEGGLPSALYVGMLAEAAEAAGAPADYVTWLQNLPCRSVG